MEKPHQNKEWLLDKYRNKNLGPKEIASLDECDVTPGSVGNWAKKYGIQRKHRDEEWLYQKYVVENMTSDEMAELAGVCSQSILNNLDRVGIDRPSKDELWDMYEAPLEGVTGEDHPWWGRTGEDHPRYKGEDYSWRKEPEWRKVRNMAKDMDDRMCVICGSENELHTHHIVPVSEGGNKHDPYNLTTLCGDCHRSVHTNYYNSSSDWDESIDWVSEEVKVYE